MNMEGIHQSYQGVSQQLGIRGWEEGKVDVKKLVQQYLCRESIGLWLLALDNADGIYMWITTPGSKPESSPLMNYLPGVSKGVETARLMQLTSIMQILRPVWPP